MVGGGCRGRCEVGVRTRGGGGGEYGQTGDAHFTMTGWVGSREGKRGSEGGRGDVEEGCWGAHGFVSAEDTQRREMGWLI